VAHPKHRKTAVGEYGESATGEAQWSISPWTMGRGIVAPPSSDAAGQLIDVAGGWARETVGSGQVSGAMVHVSKRMMVTLLAPDAGYGKSTGPP